MHYLIEQYLKNAEQVQGREPYLAINKQKTKIRFRTPMREANFAEIIIDCTDSGINAPPVILCDKALHLPPSHETHSFGNGRICLAKSISGWSLRQILVHSESWAIGYARFCKTGVFPDDPKVNLAKYQ